MLQCVAVHGPRPAGPDTVNITPHNEETLAVATAELLASRPTLAICHHDPPCPAADAVDHTAARMVATHPDQGWSLLCSGFIVFNDTGEFLPDGTPIAPR
jgi:hypothetical protein